MIFPAANSKPAQGKDSKLQEETNGREYMMVMPSSSPQQIEKLMNGKR
jgi:hypothetical protein